MDYKNLIEETRRKLESYTFDDSVYNDIYDRAYSDLNKAYSLGDININADYKQSKSKAIGENALTAKSLHEELAKRGLARSGESALLKINQGISLNNTLAQLEAAKTTSHNELISKREEALASLQKDIADKKTDAMEKEKSALYDRLEHLESLNANDEEWRSKLYAQTGSTSVAGGGSSGSADSNSGGLLSGLKNFLKPVWGIASNIINNAKSEKITPTVSATTIANNIANRYANSYGYISDADQSDIYSDLARVIATAKLSEEYALDVLTALRSRGFTKAFSIEMASKPYIRLAFEEYGTVYSDTFNRLVDEGRAEDDANANALDAALQAVYTILDRQNLSAKDYTNALQMLGLK